MLSGIGPAAHLSEHGHRMRRRSAGRQEPAGPSRRLHDLRAARARLVSPRDALRPHGGEHAARLFLRHRAGDRGAGRSARLHQDAAGACGARHRVHVPRHARITRISGFPASSAAFKDGFGIRPTLLHPDSRGEVLLRSADPRAPPRIRYNFFTAPNDLPTLRHGLQARARDGRTSRRSIPIAARSSTRATR